jgi:hypothetical protein
MHFLAKLTEYADVFEMQQTVRATIKPEMLIQPQIANI